jgi:putative glutamine amidotransferase
MSPSRPIIGITIYGKDENGRYSLPGVYVDAVRRAGGSPILLPPGEASPERVFDLIDGLILTGGGDIDPALYGGSLHETIYSTDPDRDRTEIELARAAAARDFPTLGICRGCQVINVALGGTLHEHVPDVYGSDVEHRLPPREPTAHGIALDAGCELASIIGTTNFVATSWHHQSIRDIAPGLRGVARAPDGVIEAVESPKHRWFLAVQWHPELTAAVDAAQQRIFDRFVAAAAGARRGE